MVSSTFVHSVLKWLHHLLPYIVALRQRVDASHKSEHRDRFSTKPGELLKAPPVDEAHALSCIVVLPMAGGEHSGPDVDAAVPPEEIVVSGAVVVPAVVAIVTFRNDIVFAMFAVASQLVPTWLQ